MTDLAELQKQRDYCARLCADLLYRGHLHEARKWAGESVRFAVQVRAVRAAA